MSDYKNLRIMVDMEVEVTANEDEIADAIVAAAEAHCDVLAAWRAWR